MTDEFEDSVTGNIEPERSSAAVDRLTMRLPPFWAEDAEVWFAQVEAQFAVWGVKADSTKYFQVIRELDPKTAREVRDIITKPPETDKYEKLKKQLIDRLSTSQENKRRQLLQFEELGDRKPSQFLRHLRGLAGDSVTDDFLRSLWSTRLPTQVQAIIASQKTASLDDIAILADQIIDVTPCSSFKQVASMTSFEDMFKKMEQSITARIQSEMTQQIAQLSTGPPTFCRPRRLAPDRLKIAKEQFEEMLRDGVAECAESP
ncbi:uncharacterized protein LOC134649134 [Cydia amplana]|uniref:uncharacterized protein LOC134649134 n=1 Tax=Cydia amplana TaxID=1869771 RepID=UPI002FE5205C